MTVARRPPAATAAMSVARINCRVVGRSSRRGRCAWNMIEAPMKSGDGKADELVADQHEASGHEDGVGGEGVTHEAVRSAPEAHQDQDGGKGEKLSDLDADIERDQVGEQAVARNLELDDLGGKAEAVEESEDQQIGRAHV